MKKTMQLALLICLALLACALMFTACDSGAEQKSSEKTELSTLPNNNQNNGQSDASQYTLTVPSTQVR